jgi:AcrR family transcriptional regulator
VFLADPSAPVAAVAKRAGVGISALYRRHSSKEELLRRLCHDGLRRYLDEAAAALDASDGWAGFVGFLERVVAADVHALTVRLAGSFTPTAQMRADAARSGELTSELVARARASGRLRGDVVSEDVGFLLELCAAVRVPDTERTAELRSRYLALLVAGLEKGKGGRLPGPPPDGSEYGNRWRRA